MHYLVLLVLAAAAVNAQVPTVGDTTGTLSALIPPAPVGFTLQDSDDSWLPKEVGETVKFFVNTQAQQGAFANKQTDQQNNFNLQVTKATDRFNENTAALGSNPNSPQAQLRDQKFNDHLAQIQWEHQEQVTRQKTAEQAKVDKQWVNHLTGQGVELIDAIKHDGLEVASMQKTLGNLEAEEQEIRQQAYLNLNKYNQAAAVYSASPAAPLNVRRAAKQRMLKYWRLYTQENTQLAKIDIVEARLKSNIAHERTEIGYMLQLVAAGAAAFESNLPQVDELGDDPNQPGVPSDDNPNGPEDAAALSGLW